MQVGNGSDEQESAEELAATRGVYADVLALQVSTADGGGQVSVCGVYGYCLLSQGSEDFLHWSRAELRVGIDIDGLFLQSDEWDDEAGECARFAEVHLFLLGCELSARALDNSGVACDLYLDA